ncbi:PAS domain-containing protein [Antarcticirhabdus aurantiaca]|uniref:PAS domain-containing protein n=1 Tax=Antarcticirhabdus aurantiaca TaxID=2606717 RepID=A0ACD4NNZ3_9HYPH|nr:PAS domain-containing protein [Antarcticirhabdus aurantiaca]WAJ28340.1 PAS domain-containing protein [Jeongeuplla avenae]
MDGLAWHAPNEPPIASIGFWSVDVATKRITLDPTMSVYFGVSAEQGALGIEPERVLPRVHPDDRQKAMSVLLDTIETGMPYFLIYRLEHGPRHYTPVRAIGRRFLDDAGAPSHVAGILIEDRGGMPLPWEVEVVEGLMAVLGLSRLGDDPMLTRLIEATLLHAGRSMAKKMGPSTF